MANPFPSDTFMQGYAILFTLKMSYVAFVEKILLHGKKMAKYEKNTKVEWFSGFFYEIWSGVLQELLSIK